MRRTWTRTLVEGIALAICSLSLAAAQSNSINNHTVTTLPSLVTLYGSNSCGTASTVSLPASDANLTYVTINICSLASDNGTYTPTIWLTNSSAVAQLGIPTVLDLISASKTPRILWQKDGSTGLPSSIGTNQMIAVNDQDVRKVIDGTSNGLQQQMGKSGTAFIWELHLWKGFGNWTGGGDEGVWLDIDSISDGMDIEIGVDDTGAFSRSLRRTVSNSLYSSCPCGVHRLGYARRYHRFAIPRPLARHRTTQPHTTYIPRLPHLLALPHQR